MSFFLCLREVSAALNQSLWQNQAGVGHKIPRLELTRMSNDGKITQSDNVMGRLCLQNGNFFFFFCRCHMNGDISGRAGVLERRDRETFYCPGQVRIVFCFSLRNASR